MGARQYRLKGEKKEPQIVHVGFTVGDYDPVHRIAFTHIGSTAGSAGPTAQARLAKYDEQAKVFTNPIYSAPLGTTHALTPCVACKPATQQAFSVHFEGGTTNHYLRRINYDGTGDTAIATLTGFSTVFMACNHLTYHRTLDRLYYTLQAISGTTSLRYIDAAGGSETTIYSLSGGDSFNLHEIDYINEKLWLFVQEANVRYVKRMNYDGSSLETVHTYGPNTNGMFLGGLQVSYRDQCLYTYDYKASVSAASDPDGGLFKRDFSYNQVGPRLLAREETNFVFSNFRLGCGFETLGAENQG